MQELRIEAEGKFNFHINSGTNGKFELFSGSAEYVTIGPGTMNFPTPRDQFISTKINRITGTFWMKYGVVAEWHLFLSSELLKHDSGEKLSIWGLSPGA
jgi:hypothetical protein